jgi:hypothetical protein
LITEGGHKFFAGTTGSGKTYAALRYMSLWPVKSPVLYFNPQQEDAPGMIRADGSNTMDAILYALGKGQSVNFVPDARQQVAEKQLSVLVDGVMMRQWKKTLLFCADEAQDFARQGKDSPLFAIARRGRKWGIEGMFLAQSPADVSKVLVRQARTHLIFYVDAYDLDYFRNYHIPADEVGRLLDSAGGFDRHPYVVWSGRSLSGPFVV